MQGFRSKAEWIHSNCHNYAAPGPLAAPGTLLVECRALWATGARSLNYAETTEQSRADKRRLDQEGCLSDSIVSVSKRAWIGSAVLVLPCRNYTTLPSLNIIIARINCSTTRRRIKGATRSINAILHCGKKLE